MESSYKKEAKTNAQNPLHNPEQNKSRLDPANYIARYGISPSEFLRRHGLSYETFEQRTLTLADLIKRNLISMKVLLEALKNTEFYHFLLACKPFMLFKNIAFDNVIAFKQQIDAYNKFNKNPITKFDFAIYWVIIERIGFNQLIALKARNLPYLNRLLLLFVSGFINSTTASLLISVYISHDDEELLQILKAILTMNHEQYECIMQCIFGDYEALDQHDANALTPESLLERRFTSEVQH